MSKINIDNIQGGYNSFGDNNTIHNNISIQQTVEKVLTRDDYFQIILEIRELERISLSTYLQDKLDKLQTKNPDFIKILYKDINRILDGVDKEDDNDLLVENGDFVIEYGDIKLTGYPTNFHFALIWLHTQLVESFSTQDSLSIIPKMNSFENDFLHINFDTPAYSKKISNLNKELKKEREKKDKSNSTWADLNDFLHLKPNIAGIGINFNAIFSKLINRKKKTE